MHSCKCFQTGEAQAEQLVQVLSRDVSRMVSKQMRIIMILLHLLLLQGIRGSNADIEVE